MAATAEAARASTRLPEPGRPTAPSWGGQLLDGDHGRAAEDGDAQHDLAQDELVTVGEHGALVEHEAVAMDLVGRAEVLHEQIVAVPAEARVALRDRGRVELQPEAL